MEPICYIVSAMPTPDLWIPKREGDLLVAADAGFANARNQGFQPDLVVGDFDSLGNPPEHPHIIRYPVEKDDTDTMLAVQIGVERGYRKFVILGALGGWLDHTWANCQTLLWLLKQHAQGYLVGEGQVVTAVDGGSLCFSKENEGRISVFAAGDHAEGVTLQGLKYLLCDAELTNSFPLGVSNSFVGMEAEISVRKGALFVMWQQDAKTVIDRIVKESRL